MPCLDIVADVVGSLANDFYRFCQGINEYAIRFQIRARTLMNEVASIPSRLKHLIQARAVSFWSSAHTQKWYDRLANRESSG